MSEKIIVLHPENQPEVDIYPIIKEGSIPNSVIDNQKIKSRTIINSNIALNTLKYEVLHQTLKDLIDSKITQVNMQNYLSSYYYNVEETQQYVGSEINTLHQTIQNEFYSKTTIDDMLMEKTDLSLFRQYLSGSHLSLVKGSEAQAKSIILDADSGSINVSNLGNINNNATYYFPNSIVKTEDAQNGYYVLSTTNDDYQSLYNLGAYDKITTNSDGTYTITRQTEYLNSNDLLKAGVIYCNPSNNYVCEFRDILNVNSSGLFTDIICNLFPFSTESNVLNRFYAYNTSIYLKIDGLTTADAYKQYVAQNNLFFQYKLATPLTTEKVEKNHYSLYNKTFILEHNKSEAERSANVFNIDAINPTYAIKISNNEFKATSTDYELFKTNFKEKTQYTISGYARNENTSYGGRLVIYYTDNTSENCLLNEGTSYVYKTFTSKANKTIKYISHTYNTGVSYSYYKNLMLNEGTTPLPYQAYEGKTIHEKDLGNYTNIYNVSQLYQHHYELEAIPSNDTIYVTCWSTKSDKILLKDITRYAFSNVQVYNSGNDETIQVIKWASSGFRYINDSGNIDSNGYTVTNYYINGEPTTY